MTHRLRLASVLCLCALIFAACGGDDDDSAAPGGEGVVVTFSVAGSEEYRIRLTNPDHVAIARQLLAGEAAPSIPNGVVVRGETDVNEGYSWHIDPESLEFADFTAEVCDGLPSDVEAELITSDRYCPWSAEVIAIDEG